MALNLETVLDRYERRQKALGKRTADQVRTLWRQVDPRNIGSSWRSLLPQAHGTVSNGQAAAATLADRYVADALYAQGARDLDIAGDLRPLRLSGVASDGRDLVSLLYQPAISTLVALGQGATVERAMATGLMKLDVISRTQVADASRAAETVNIASRPRVTGYVRMLSGKSCSRCIILAGRRYRWNAGFRRHPRCDCRHVPAMEDVPGAVETNPKLTFESMNSAEQNRAFTKAGAEAIRNGADINQVVNARRGMDTAVVFGRTVQHTREGVTRYGQAGRRLKGPVRLMPEQILIEANGNREEAIRLLRLHGYIT